MEVGWDEMIHGRRKDSITYAHHATGQSELQPGVRLNPGEKARQRSSRAGTLGKPAGGGARAPRKGTGLHRSMSHTLNRTPVKPELRNWKARSAAISGPAKAFVDARRIASDWLPKPHQSVSREETFASRNVVASLLLKPYPGNILQHLTPSNFGVRVKSRSENCGRADGGSFGWGLRWPDRYSPLRGCAGRAASAAAKIPRRHPRRNFQTGSKTL